MQPQMSQQTGGQTQVQQIGQRLQDVETPQQQAVVGDITRAIQVCEWCADQCVQAADPNMVECIRLCEDVAEFGETAVTLIPRNSRYVQQHLQTLQQVLQACAQECGQHSHAHCQECAEVLPRVAQSIQQYIGSFQQQGF